MTAAAADGNPLVSDVRPHVAAWRTTVKPRPSFLEGFDLAYDLVLRIPLRVPSWAVTAIAYV